MFKQLDAKGDYGSGDGANGPEMTSPTCTDISPAMHPPSFPAITQGYYTPSTMNCYSPNKMESDNLLADTADRREFGLMRQPALLVEANAPIPQEAKPAPSVKLAPEIPTVLSGSVLAGGIEVAELSSVSQEISVIDTATSRHTLGLNQGGKHANRFSHLMSKPITSSTIKQRIKQPDIANHTDQLSQSVSVSMTGELSRLEVTEDEEQRLERHGVSIDAIQQTLNHTYPNATDAQKVRKLLQILANTTIINTQLQSEKDELLQQLKQQKKAQETEEGASNYLTERAQIFETRTHAAEEKLARAEQEILEYKRGLRTKAQEIESLMQRCTDLARSCDEAHKAAEEMEANLEEVKKHAAALQDENTTLSADVKYLKKYNADLEESLTSTKTQLIETQVDLRKALTKASTEGSAKLQSKISDLETQIQTLTVKLNEQNERRDMAGTANIGPAVSLQDTHNIEAIHMQYQQQFIEKQMEIVDLKTQLQQLSAELTEQAGLRYTITEQHANEKRKLEDRNRDLTLMVETLTRRASASEGPVAVKQSATVHPEIQMEVVEETMYSDAEPLQPLAESHRATPSQMRASCSVSGIDQNKDREIELLEQENRRLEQDNEKLLADKTKLKNALKQIKQLQREYEASQNTLHHDAFSRSDDSRRSSVCSNTDDAIMMPGTTIPKPTELLKNQVSLLKIRLSKTEEELVDLQQQLKGREEESMRLQIENKLLTEKLEANETRIVELQKDIVRLEMERSRDKDNDVVHQAMKKTEIFTEKKEKHRTPEVPNVNDLHEASKPQKVACVGTATKGTNTDEAPENAGALKKVQRELQELQTKYDALQEQIEEEKSVSKALKEALQMAKNDKSKTDSEVPALKEEIERLNARIAELQDELASADKQVRSYTSLVAAIHTANSANAEKLRLMENREQIELARKDDTITALRNEVAIHQGEIAMLKKELYIRDEETRRLMAKSLALESRCMGLISSHAYNDTAISGLVMTATGTNMALDSTGVGQPIVDAVLRSSSRQLRGKLNSSSAGLGSRVI